MEDPGQLLEFLEFVHPEGSLSEIRLLGQRPRTCSGLFNAPKAAVTALQSAIARWPDAKFYYTLNPINPDCAFARSMPLNRIIPSPKATAKDADILHRSLYLIDIDPARESGTSSTKEERYLAREVVRSVRSMLYDLGWPKPTLVSSGSGYHLLYRATPSDSMNVDLKAVLASLAARFDTQAVKIDRSVSNLARISRLPQTWNRKGLHTPQRPHRLAKALNLGESGAVESEKVSELILQPLEQGLVATTNNEIGARSATMPAPARAGSYAICALTEAEVHELLEYYKEHLPLARVFHEGARVRFQLQHCPVKGCAHMNQTSGAGKTAILWSPGVLGFKCFSDDCAHATIGMVLRRLTLLTGRRFPKPIWKPASNTTVASSDLKTAA